MLLPDRRHHTNRSAFISDVHAPRHDEVALSGLLESLSDWKPTTLFLLGDIWDCEEISRHPKTLDGHSDLQKSIDVGVQVVKSIIDACGRVRPRVFLMYGNHEDRWQKWLANQAPAASTLRCLRMNELFRMQEVGISEVFPYGHVMKWNGLALSHGRKCAAKAGMTGHKMLIDNGCSGVSGHVHRLCRVDVNRSSGPIFHVENGCLCRMDVDFIDGVPDWQHGFSVGFQGIDQYEVVPVKLRGSINPKVTEVR